MKIQSGEIIFYTSENGDIKINIFFENETIWASQKQIAEIFGVDRSVISKHIKNIFESFELDEKVVCAKIAHTTEYGAIKEKSQTREIQIYNLDLILSVGYRVNSYKATQFRIWANSILKEFIIKGFVMDDERFLKSKQNKKQNLSLKNTELYKIKTISVILIDLLKIFYNKNYD